MTLWATTTSSVLDIVGSVMGHSVSWTPSGGGATETVNAVLDQPSRHLIDGQIMAIDYKITFPATSFVALVESEILVINGGSYEVRFIEPLTDGTKKVAYLNKI